MPVLRSPVSPHGPRCRRRPRGRRVAARGAEGRGIEGRDAGGGQAIAGLIRTLQSNWEWLIATGVGLVLVLLAGLMIFGSIRATDHLFRVIGGIMLILVVIPAVLA